MSEALVHSGLREAADMAIEIAFAAIGECEGDRNLLSDNLVEINGSVFGKQLGRDAEKPGNALVRGKAYQEKYVFPQGRLDGYDSIFLRIWHISYVPSLWSR